MNKQRIVEDVWARLKEQGAPGFDKTEQCCQYITSDGRRCAVGVLLPMDYLYESIDDFGGGVSELFERHPRARELIEGQYGAIETNFMQELQYAHDNAATDVSVDDGGFLDRFRKQLRRLEEEHDIDTEKLT